MANLYISRQLKAARKSAGLIQRDVYEWLGVGQSTFSAWETGQSEPPIGVFLKLCQKYGISDIMSYFMPDSPQRTIWESLEPDFLNKLTSLPPRGRAAVKNCLEFEHRSAQEKIVPLRRVRPIPLYTQAATAGLGSFLDDQDATLCEMNAPDEADFAVRISGDSMEPMIADGETVFVHRQPHLTSGEIGVFVYNGDSYCKMWDDRGGVPRLISLNKSYAPILLNSSDSFYVCGKVIL